MTWEEYSEINEVLKKLKQGLRLSSDEIERMLELLLNEYKDRTAP